MDPVKKILGDNRSKNNKSLQGYLDGKIKKGSNVVFSEKPKPGCGQGEAVTIVDYNPKTKIATLKSMEEGDKFKAKIKK